MTAAVPAAPQPPPAPTPGQALDVRAPEPGESREAYKAYLDGLFAPVGAEVQRLRAGLADGSTAPGRPLTAPDVVAGLLADVAESRAQLADAAPELAAAMAETRQVRDGYASLCREFADSPQSGQSARISLTVLNRHRKAAGLASLRPAPSGDREDVTMRYRRERDEAREQAEQAELERNEARDRLARALAANQRWAETLGDVQQRHTEVKRERDKAREKLATTQAIARMLQATAFEILAAYESGTVVSDELTGIWRARLGGDGG